MFVQKLTLRALASLTLFALLVAAVPAAAAPAASGKVNINTASAQQLTLLPRVGPAVAQRILDFRKDNGPFKKAEDLMLVRGIGEKTYEGMAPYITLSGETTLSSKVRTSRDAKAAQLGAEPGAQE